jgi:hypothetical protein
MIGNNRKPAAIEYVGKSGISAECKRGVLRLLQYGDEIERARILSCSGTHALLLTINNGDLVAVKTGFGSGYGGEAPKTFSFVLALLEAYDVEIEEFDVKYDVLERLDMSALTVGDLVSLDKSRPVLPTRWYDYVSESHWEKQKSGALWVNFRSVMPFSIIDDRLVDLAIRFFGRPDDCLLTGYRRLEDVIRKRTLLAGQGVKLFSEAFKVESPRLYWDGLDENEHRGRAMMFTAITMTYRNPRAHRELQQDVDDQLREFILLNQLFVLERTAKSR